jgi:acetylornithine deacetylase
VGEPTLMKIVGAHKGGAKLVTSCHGREHHSSAPEKSANAVMMAGEFVAMLDDVWNGLRADADPRFDPAHSTVQATVISGGTAVNILARQAEVTWEYRCLPDRDPKQILETVQRRAENEILPKYRARAAEAALTTKLHAQYPGLKMDEDSPAVRLVREVTGANQVEAVSYGTEAGHFQNYGIPAVICGPGSIEQAHRADEFCEVSELTACEAFLRKVIMTAQA